MPLALLCAVFLASGASALIFETVWFFQAGLGFGNGLTASSVVLAGFMGGMALGGWVAARRAARLSDARQAYAAYALLEGAVAVSGVALSYALPGVHRWHGVLTVFGAEGPALLAARAALAFLLLGVPATAIGMTLPVLAHALERRNPSFGRVLGLLYGVNTLGAVVGTLATEHALLGSLGVRGTAWCAAALDVGVAAVAWTYSRRAASPAPPSDVPSPAPPGDAARPPAWPWVTAAFASGFLLLALEVVWLRVLTLFLNDTPLAFATVLALVLAGVAGGGVAGSLWSSRSAEPEAAAPWLAYGAGLAGFLGYLAYPLALERLYTGSQGASVVFAIAGPLVIPASLASGALYVGLGAGLRAASGSHAVAAGRLSFANTLGAMLGPLVTGFVIVPRLGMERALFLALVAYGVLGLCLTATRRRGRARALALAPAFACGLAFFPFGRVGEVFVAASAARWSRPGDTVQAVREGLTGTIVHLVHRANGAPIFDQVASNAYSMTVNDFIGRRYMKLFSLLPEALHPRLRRVAVVGYGIGNTVEAITDDHDVERVDLADISRDLLEVSRGVLTRPRRPLDDPRVHVHLEDGRYFLATASEQYDLITGEPPPPVIAGVVALYTQEYFELVRERLAPSGMATYWLPMMNLSSRTASSIIAAFCAAFADCSLWQGGAENLMLLGTKGASDRATVVGFTRMFRDAARVAELRAIGLEQPTQFGALFIGDAEYLHELTVGAPPLTDDWPRRISQPGTPEERAEFVATLRDTKAARRRFAESAFVKAHWPKELLGPTLAQFENQRLLDDLTDRKPRWARTTKVLHQVLFGTHLRLPVLLILKSTPDVQRALSALPEAKRDEPAWLPHRVAGALAERDFPAALSLLERSTPGSDALPDLRDYVRYEVERGSGEPARDPGAPEPRGNEATPYRH